MRKTTDKEDDIMHILITINAIIWGLVISIKLITPAFSYVDGGGSADNVESYSYLVILAGFVSGFIIYFIIKTIYEKLNDTKLSWLN